MNRPNISTVGLGALMIGAAALAGACSLREPRPTDPEYVSDRMYRANGATIHLQRDPQGRLVTMREMTTDSWPLFCAYAPGQRNQCDYTVSRFPLTPELATAAKEAFAAQGRFLYLLDRARYAARHPAKDGSQ